MLATTVQLTGAVAHDTYMEIHTSTLTTYTSLAKEFQKHISDPSRETV